MTRGSRTVFNSRVELFPKKSQTEKYRSACHDSLQLRLASILPSYRACEEILNRIRWQDEENTVKHRTLSEAVEREGNKIIDCIDKKATKILEENNFDAVTGTPLDVDSVDMAFSA